MGRNSGIIIKIPLFLDLISQAPIIGI